MLNNPLADISVHEWDQICAMITDERFIYNMLLWDNLTPANQVKESGGWGSSFGIDSNHISTEK